MHFVGVSKGRVMVEVGWFGKLPQQTTPPHSHTRDKVRLQHEALEARAVVATRAVDTLVLTAVSLGVLCVCVCACVRVCV